MRTLLFQLTLTFALAGCGFEQFIFEELTRGDQVELPKTAPNLIEGLAPMASGGTVTVFAGAGTVLEPLTSDINEAGEFRIQAPGNTEFVNLILVAQSPTASVWGLAPQVAAQTSVTSPPQILPLDFLQPDMGELNADTTLAVLMVLAKARSVGLPVSSLAPGATSGAISEIVTLKDSDPRIVPLKAMVDRIVAGSPGALAPFPASADSYLKADVLGDFDYTGDGSNDSDSVAFDAALADAISAFQFNACYPDNTVRLVLMADIRPGKLDRNCSEIDNFRWAEDATGKTMFVTGAIHIDTPRCGETAPPCLDDAEIDAGTQALGNFEPNQIRMYDDGTHGDALAGDGVWTIALDLPWFPPGDLSSAGVRVGYKYTYGFPGQGWTGSEEWPGNKRIVELRDLNGDRLVTRLDVFGDETTNKDKSNLLSPAKGGCGTVVFPSQETKPSCTYDALENQVDTDGDCELDSMPTPGVASPLTIDCPE